MPVLDGALIRRIVLVSLLLLAGAFGLFLRELEQGHTLAEARTVAVNVFVMVEMFYLFNCRSLTGSFWRLGIFSNLWVWGGIAAMPPCNCCSPTGRRSIRRLPDGADRLASNGLEISASPWAVSADRRP
jgi:magnesium-transporting ATPase (P-type)